MDENVKAVMKAHLEEQLRQNRTSLAIAENRIKDAKKNRDYAQEQIVILNAAIKAVDDL